jgi:hypothetical protein
MIPLTDFIPDDVAIPIAIVFLFIPAWVILPAIEQWIKKG